MRSDSFTTEWHALGLWTFGQSLGIAGELSSCQRWYEN